MWGSDRQTPACHGQLYLLPLPLLLDESSGFNTNSACAPSNSEVLQVLSVDINDKFLRLFWNSNVYRAHKSSMKCGRELKIVTVGEIQTIMTFIPNFVKCRHVVQK
jgi:hypothetical protein